MIDVMLQCMMCRGEEEMPRPSSSSLCMWPKGNYGLPCPTYIDRLCCPRAMMPYHAQCYSTVYAVYGQRLHAMPDVVPLSMLSKGKDVESRLISFDRVCFPIAMMACHARRHPTVCAAEGKCGHAMPMSVDRVYCPRAMITYETQLRPIFYRFQG